MTDLEELPKVPVDSRSGNRDPGCTNIQDCDPIMSNEGRRLLEIIFFVALSGAVSVAGSVANVINIIIFFKQGFNDSVNISLMGLAVSDLGALLTLVWMSICFNPLFQYSNIEFDSTEVQYLTAGWPLVCFSGITSWITAFISFERCICIALPMKVKDIITPRRTLITMVAIFVVMFASVSPVFCTIHFASSFHPQRNKSLYGLSYAKNGPDVENVSFSITVFGQLSSFIIVIVCTVTLIHNLLINSRWRRRVTTSSANTNSMTSRDKRVLKMVTSISCIFIACFLPSAVNLILMIHFSPEYSIVGTYQNSFLVSWSILNTIEAVNSSVNILVYYNMSSKFRAVFKTLFVSGINNVKDT